MSFLELKWFHQPQFWKPFFHWPHLSLAKWRSRGEPGSLQWQGRERNIKFTHRAWALDPGPQQLHDLRGPARITWEGLSQLSPSLGLWLY